MLCLLGARCDGLDRGVPGSFGRAKRDRTWSGRSRLVQEESASKIGRITPAGSLTEYPLPTGNSGLGGIATGPDGNIWFTESKGNKLGRLIPATGQINEFATGKSFGGIVGGSDGNLWIMAPQANAVLVASTAGVVLHTYVVPTTGGYPHGPTLGPDGNVYFAEINGNKVARITPAGQITEWTDPLANAKPMVLAFGPDGKLYFTENQANKIGTLNTSTGSLTHWAVPKSNASPLGMALGPDGNPGSPNSRGTTSGGSRRADRSPSSPYRRSRPV